MRLITTDYHMHSTFSPDGDDSPAALCQRALDLGLTEIAITEHAEWHPTFSNKGLPRADTYFEAIAACQAQFQPQGLMVYAGIELGNPHQYQQEAAALLAQYPFDIVLGSLHWLDGINIHHQECFAHRPVDEVYAAYFTQLGQMAQSFEVDVITHFDRIIWRGTLLGNIFDPYPLEPTIRGAFAAIVRAGRTLELNTTHLHHPQNWNEALVIMLRWFIEAGGRQIVVNSDAHRLGEVGRNHAIAQELLSRAGFQLPQQLLRLGEVVGHRRGNPM